MAARTGPVCGGERRGGKGPCQLPAGYKTSHVGTGRCSWHGGASPNGTKAAREQEVSEQAARELARLDVPPVTDPLTELARLAGQAVAWKDMMAAKVNELSGIRYESERGGEQLRAEIALWERALDRCVATLTAMAKLNLDERQMRITEGQARLVNEVLRGALAELGLDPQSEAVRPVIARHLRIVAEHQQHPALAPADARVDR